MLLLALLPICAGANDVYRIRPLSERELVNTYESIMDDCCRHSVRDWHDSTFDPRAGYWGDGVSAGNEGIRAIGNMVLTSAALLKYSHPNDTERRELMDKAVRGLRYTVATHVTGTQKCTDGKQWGGSWQSGMWTSTLCFGAWLIWDDLDPELQAGVERVVASEADRLLAVKLPTGRWGDTKAEENGWDLTCLSLAANMFPDHPHAAAWNEKAIEYMMNTLSVPRDLKDESIVDGKPVKEWVHGANLHPDFTLENHDKFHPSYVACSSYFLALAAMHYAYAHRPIPQAATHHLMDTWGMFQTIMLPCGESVFPQGMDWELHGLPYINLFAFLATKMHDPLAAEYENNHLQYIRAWQNMQAGDLAVPGSRLGFCRHAIFAEQATYGLLSHKLFGSDLSDKSDLSDQSCTRTFSSIGVLLHRTQSKIATFSWKNRIMGMLTPIGEGHEGNPHFTVPITDGFVGTFQPGNDRKVVERTWKKTSNGFETTGELLANGGRLKQVLRMTSIGEKTVVYQDRVTALSDVSIERELGVPVGIENDRLTAGKRVVCYQGGKTIFDWQQPQKPFAIPRKWVNVDSRLGAVSVLGSGMTYVQASEYNPQAVYADVLYGSYSDQPKVFKAGDEVAHRIIVFFTEVTPEETSRLAKSIRIEGNVLCLTLPEGGQAQVPLQ
ncbi:MAG TPA: hypothetical protein VFI02_02710 [Armatimonadota bacterium]|nr:hypothetical protein [Armatimonadota bacterium]